MISDTIEMLWGMGYIFLFFLSMGFLGVIYAYFEFHIKKNEKTIKEWLTLIFYIAIALTVVYVLIYILPLIILVLFDGGGDIMY